LRKAKFSEKELTTDRYNCRGFLCDPAVVFIIWKYFSIVKPTRCTIFEFIEYHSTFFGWSFSLSSGVQDCIHSIRYMSYRL